jgi:protein MAK11
MKLIHTITHPSRIHDILFAKRVMGEGELLLVAAEDKKVTIYDISSDPDCPPSIISEMMGHENRVKAVDTLSIALPYVDGQPKSSTTLAATISSDGKIRVFDLADVPAGMPSPNDRTQLSAVAEYDTKGTRLTCMSMADGDSTSGPAPSIGEKRKRDAHDDVGFDEQEDTEEGDDVSVGGSEVDEEMEEESEEEIEDDE